jgi:shikimate dehydrogenase
VDKFGLIGKNIDYSFSRGYFKQKFEKEKIKATYVNFDLQDLSEFPSILAENNLKGLNVTIPYKTDVISYLDDIDAKAKAIGAVNTITFKNGKLKGYNTDVFGFMYSIRPLLKNHHKKALVLGSGGASKAICYGCTQLGIDFKVVTRTPSYDRQLGYQHLTKELMEDYTIIINCTPLGTED